MKSKLFACTAVFALLLAACGGGAPEDTAPAPAETGQTATNTTESSSQDSADAEAQSAALNAFFEEVFDEEVARSPMTQTYLGIKTDYDKWDDVSPERAMEDMRACPPAPRRDAGKIWRCGPDPERETLL